MLPFLFIVVVLRSLRCGRTRRLTRRACIFLGLCPFTVVSGFRIAKDELDALPLSDEEFVILRRSVEDKKNLLKK